MTDAPCPGDDVAATPLRQAAITMLRDAMVQANVFGYYPDQTDMAEMPVEVWEHLREHGWSVVPGLEATTDRATTTFGAGWAAGRRAMADELARELGKHRA